MARRRSRGGTSIRTGWDVKRLGKALAAQGLDLRHWFSYGTVATVGGDGGPNFTDSTAVVISPAGIDVDVILEPSGYHCACRWGMQHGSVYIATPIHAGDQVVVGIPDGDVSMVPEILKIIPGASDPIPTDGGMPIFKNDRALIMARGVPIDLRTDGGSQIMVNPDGTVVINAGNKGAARLDDTIVATLAGSTAGGVPLPSSLQALALALLATGMFLPNPSPPTPPPSQPDFPINGKITGASSTVTVGG